MAELSINDRFMNPNEKFIDRMRLKSPKSYSIISYNINMGEAATWNTVGGTAITLDCNFNSHRTKESNGSKAQVCRPPAERLSFFGK